MLAKKTKEGKGSKILKFAGLAVLGLGLALIILVVVIFPIVIPFFLAGAILTFRS